MKKIAVCALIEKDNLVLGVARRGSFDQWGLPGGKVDQDEDPVSALVREVKEESNLHLDSDKLTEVFKASNGPYNVITYRYSGNISEFKQGDAGPVEWITWRDLLNGPFADYNRKLFNFIQ
jgi:8-oxo-dGTP pyrophosphatase MutT (NUDIX family)